MALAGLLKGIMAGQILNLLQAMLKVPMPCGGEASGEVTSTGVAMRDWLASLLYWTFPEKHAWAKPSLIYLSFLCLPPSRASNNSESWPSKEGPSGFRNESMEACDFFGSALSRKTQNRPSRVPLSGELRLTNFSYMHPAIVPNCPTYATRQPINAFWNHTSGHLLLDRSRCFQVCNVSGNMCNEVYGSMTRLTRAPKDRLTS